MAIDRTYQIDLAVTLSPIWFNNPPTIRIGINGQLENISLDKKTTFNYSYAKGESNDSLQIELYGKTNKDCNLATGQDTAIIIDSIVFNGITSPHFIWNGVYRPIYDNSYIQDCAKNGTVLKSTLNNATYLGWNGTWILDYSLPIFTWIHKVENLGWFYD